MIAQATCAAQAQRATGDEGMDYFAAWMMDAEERSAWMDEFGREVGVSDYRLENTGGMVMVATYYLTDSRDAYVAVIPPYNVAVNAECGDCASEWEFYGYTILNDAGERYESEWETGQTAGTVAEAAAAFRAYIENTTAFRG